jgi:RNA polymerase sigma factor (sigma-70 family)
MIALQRNPRWDAELHARLSRRTLEGRYEISESELVLSIRACQGAGDIASRDFLCEILLERCAPEFERHSWGLRQRPDLREEAISGMREHVLREALNPKERFIVQNFIHYLRCACVDEFNRVLRDEGMRYRRDEEGRPVGRPTRVPRVLVEHLQPIQADGEGSCDIPDQEDQYERLHAREEALRLLACLADPRDRRIVALRALEGLSWDEIAGHMHLNERSVRLHYAKALARMRAQVAREGHDGGSSAPARMTA